MASVKWIITPPMGVAIRPAVTPGYSTPNAIMLEFAETDTDNVLLFLKSTWEYYDMNKNGAGAAAEIWKQRAREALGQPATVPPEVAVMEQPRPGPAAIPPEQRLAAASAANRASTALGIPVAAVPQIPIAAVSQKPPEMAVTTTNPPPSSPGIAESIIEGIHPPTTPPVAPNEHYNPLLDGCLSCGGELEYTFFNGAMAIKCKVPGCPGIPSAIVPLKEESGDGGEAST